MLPRMAEGRIVGAYFGANAFKETQMPPGFNNS